MLVLVLVLIRGFLAACLSLPLSGSLAAAVAPSTAALHLPLPRAALAQPCSPSSASPPPSRSQDGVPQAGRVARGGMMYFDIRSASVHHFALPLSALCCPLYLRIHPCGCRSALLCSAPRAAPQHVFLPLCPLLA